MAIPTQAILHFISGSNSSFFIAIFEHYTACRKKLENKKKDLEAIYTRYPRPENNSQDGNQEDYLVAFAAYRNEVLTCLKEFNVLEVCIQDIKSTLS